MESFGQNLSCHLHHNFTGLLHKHISGYVVWLTLEIILFSLYQLVTQGLISEYTVRLDMGGYHIGRVSLALW